MPKSAKPKPGRAQQQKNDDARVYRIVSTLALALASLILLMRIDEGLTHGTIPALLEINRALSVAGPVLGGLALVALSLGLFVFRQKRATLFYLFGLCAVWSVAALAVARYDQSALRVLYAAIPGAAVLYAVSQLYRPDFTAVTAICEVGLLYGWIFPEMHRNGGNDQTVAFAASAALSVLGGLLLVALFLLRQDKHKKRFRLFLPPLFASAALLLAVPGASALLGPAVAGYAIFAFVAVFFVSAVVYTVRLM